MDIYWTFIVLMTSVLSLCLYKKNNICDGLTTDFVKQKTSHLLATDHSNVHV